MLQEQSEYLITYRVYHIIILTNFILQEIDIVFHVRGEKDFDFGSLWVYLANIHEIRSLFLNLLFSNSRIFIFSSEIWIYSFKEFADISHNLIAGFFLIIFQILLKDYKIMITLGLPLCYLFEF